MSGIAGIVHRDARPVERELLEKLTAIMTRRGPDGRQIWLDGASGFGFTRLATTEETRREKQPLSLDGEVWIVADARIDGRRELIGKLEGAGRDARDATDAALILHAYETWGDEAVTHLLGDFAFAIWDRRRQILFAARDHFGVKPFYYAEWDGGLVFSNTLECLRRHPEVDSRLDDQAIADFLLFGTNLNPGTTTFADIRRLPPAHWFEWSTRGLDLRRYWELPDGSSPVSEPREGWVEKFRSVLHSAVADRLRTDRVAVFMSGGLDSTAVAATAHRLYAERGAGPGIHCYTLGYEQLIIDREGHFATQVARSLPAPIDFIALDEYRLAERWGELPISPEPRNHVYDAIYHDLDARVAKDHRVALTGLGSDPLLTFNTRYLAIQLRQLRLGTATRYLASSLLSKGRLPPLGLHGWLRRRRERRNWRRGYPSWLNPDFETALDLESRWRWYRLERRPRKTHPTHPGAHRSIWDIIWTNSFERDDPGARPRPIEQRYPFFDVRLVELLLEVPVVPWCLDKHLLREAMLGVLPETVRRRSCPSAGPRTSNLPSSSVRVQQKGRSNRTVARSTGSPSGPTT